MNETAEQVTAMLDAIDAVLSKMDVTLLRGPFYEATMKCLHEGLAEVSVVKHRQTGVFGVRLVSQAPDDSGSVVAVGDDEGMVEKVAQLMVVSLVRHEVASSLMLETDEQLPN